jgi:hypothetical protein
VSWLDGGFSRPTKKKRISKIIIGDVHPISMVGHKTTVYLKPPTSWGHSPIPNHFKSTFMG